MGSSHDDYDNPWKDMITRYFRELILFFFPDAANGIDWNRPVVFLDKEFQQISRTAELGRRTADKLARVYTMSGNETWVLVHVEVQSQYETDFARRIYTYNYRIFDMYDKSVVSLVILADDHPRWKPSAFGYELWGCELSLKYPVSKLIEFGKSKDSCALLEKHENLFAVVVKAHLKALETRKNPSGRYDSKFALIRALYEQGFNKQEIIDLFSFIDWVMRLPEELEKSLWHELEAIEKELRMPYITSVEKIGFEKGEIEGFEKGEIEGTINLLSKQIALKFKKESDELIPMLSLLSKSQLEEIGEKFFQAKSFDEIKQWISQA
ncbi:DUF4351 domain-containing protein [Desulfobacter latus]|uniref:DUF4351 domain-containing protein n=1 Tax=Desulfobacter latus TaxID=2292 RepID=A0A850TDM5_9BACT|nr:DUF4351 domain-containing protein [Desulfobacter latus]NWH06928.1 DUF4351 domain-containing protein [Desulfobacter latus]